MKVSTRIQGRVTSISLNNSICVMHYLLTSNGKQPLQDHMNDFVMRNVLPYWKGDTAKGLSTFVTHLLIQDCLDEEDAQELNTMLKDMP